MTEQLEFQSVQGKEFDKEIVVYALSTCGFCMRAMEFLDRQKLPYKYIYLDKIPLETKRKVKQELKETYKRSLVFPFVVVDGTESLTGFVKEKWQKLLGLV